MWHLGTEDPFSGPGFTDAAPWDTDQIDVPMGGPIARWFEGLEQAGRWSDFFEVVPRLDLGLLLVRRRDRHHSSGESAFWEAILGLLRVWERGGVAPLRKERIEDFFRLLDPAEQFDCDASERFMTGELNP